LSKSKKSNKIAKGRTTAGGRSESHPIDNWNSRRVTTFYPQYGEGRDRVEPIKRIHTVKFQQVIPRYNLSATNTRDDGVGPMFEEVVYATPIYRRKRKKFRPSLSQKVQKKRNRIRINFSI